MYLIHGHIYTALTPDEAIAMLTSRLNEAIPIKSQTLFACAAHFVERLDDATFLPDLSAAHRAEIIRFCQPDTMRRKLNRELGDNPFSVRRINFTESHFEGWRPLGVVVHITSSNAELLPFFAVLEGLLVGNVNWLRPSSSDQGLTILLLQAFISCDLAGEIEDSIAVVPVRTDELPLLLAHADGVSAWGGDVALDAIRHMLPSGCRWIPWGHKISFSWLIPDMMDERLFNDLADEVCRVNQLACTSPQLIFVDSDDREVLLNIGDQLAQAMQRRQSQWASQIPDEKCAADITRMMILSKLNNVFSGEDSAIWNGEGWRILWQNISAIEPSPLYRTILLRPLPREHLLRTLRPWRAHLQTCGLAAKRHDIVPLSQWLFAAGVNRITPLSKMHESYIGEPHDGVYALSQLTRRVSLTLDTNILSHQANLDLNPPPPVFVKHPPIMDRAAFIEDSLQPCAQLFFRSGGSCGMPKLSGFTSHDYHRQMSAAAAGLFAAGLQPDKDKVLNLMYAGNLYGGLLSFFTILDKLGATHYPIGGPLDGDYEAVAQLIVNQGIDTIIGMPSTVYQLFRKEDAILRAYGGVKKLMLGGEHMGTPQRKYIKEFGVNKIISALYGSTDAGPLGHACHASPDGVFHLMTDIQWLEIVHSDCDQPVAFGEVGRLLFTSIGREGQKVIRYDIGDIGRWVAGKCDCGALSPRFELIGRYGATVRVGTWFIHPDRLATLANVPVQIILEHNFDSGLPLIRLFADGDPTLVRSKISADPELAMALKKGALELCVINRPFTRFERQQQSGKTPLLIDKRQ